ncbi:hypothetical protein GCK32_015888 [Trichostrongylus colubriformis]|uniref:Uncharacterized protein n=1 Tax=Trichostrongylus colubriformis TaxID=6319 RepID=A0AAN8FZD6_TRICO
MVIQASVALALLPLLYPATSLRVYEDICLRVNASEVDKYNAMCLVLFIYDRGTHCYSQHYYEPLRFQETNMVCDDYGEHHPPKRIACIDTLTPEFGKDEVDALYTDFVERVIKTSDNHTAECIKNRIGVTTPSIGARTVSDNDVATTTSYDKASVSFIGVVSDDHTRASISAGDHTEATSSTGTTAVQGTTSTPYIDTITSSAIVTETSSTHNTTTTSSIVAMTATDNSTATVTGIDGIGTPDSERERIRRQSKYILERAKLRLFVISFIMTVVLAVQFLLIKRFRELSRQFHEEKKKELIMSEVEDLYEMGNRNIKKVKQPTSNDKNANHLSFEKLRQRLSATVLGQPGKNP